MCGKLSLLPRVDSHCGHKTADAYRSYMLYDVIITVLLELFFTDFLWICHSATRMWLYAGEVSKWSI